MVEITTREVLGTRQRECRRLIRYGERDALAKGGVARLQSTEVIHMLKGPRKKWHCVGRLGTNKM